MYICNKQLQVELEIPPSLQKKRPKSTKLISGLLRKMRSRRAGEKCQLAHRMPPPLCLLLLLLLLLAGAAAALPLEGGLAGHDGGVSSL